MPYDRQCGHRNFINQKALIPLVGPLEFNIRFIKLNLITFHSNEFHTQPAQQPPYAATLTGQTSYVARIVPDTVLSDRCEKFSRQPGSVASTGGCSSEDFEKEKQLKCLPSLMSEK
ncbi:hypothetical protein Tco_0978730, partial [Tanacetum coccineum]